MVAREEGAGEPATPGGVAAVGLRTLRSQCRDASRNPKLSFLFFD